MEAWLQDERSKPRSIMKPMPVTEQVQQVEETRRTEEVERRIQRKDRKKKGTPLPIPFLFSCMEWRFPLSPFPPLLLLLRASSYPLKAAGTGSGSGATRGKSATATTTTTGRGATIRMVRPSLSRSRPQHRREL